MIFYSLDLELGGGERLPEYDPGNGLGAGRRGQGARIGEVSLDMGE